MNDEEKWGKRRDQELRIEETSEMQEIRLRKRGEES